jgi:hypothetical protein
MCEVYPDSATRYQLATVIAPQGLENFSAMVFFFGVDLPFYLTGVVDE